MEVSATPLPPVPETPPGLAAIAGDAQISSSWNPVAGATQYLLKRSPVSGGGFSPISTNTATLSIDPTVSNGVLQQYVISAANIAGESSDSVEAAARPTSASPPQLGANLAAGGLTLAWPSGHTGWQLFAQTNNSGEGIRTNWILVEGSSETNQIAMPINTANGSVFFRLAHPRSASLLVERE